jgi:O-antigen ligase
MMSLLRRTHLEKQWWWYALIVAVLLLAAALGFFPSPLWLVLVGGIAALLILMRRPVLGLFVLILAALLIRVFIGTGTEVTLNGTVLLIPLLIVIWLLVQVSQHAVRLPPSRVNLPLVLFLISNLLSLFIGNATWDPTVPRAANFTLVQFAQWGLFLFSAVVFWLAGSQIKSETWLRRLTAFCLIVSGILAVVRIVPRGAELTYYYAPYTVNRAPFWLLLTALATGQLLYNRALSMRWKVFLVVALGAVVLFAFGDQKERSSYWVSIVTVVGVLIWLRIPRVRLVTAMAVVLFAASGVLSQFIYEFAGGDAKWEESGGSRLALSGAVIKLAMRDPIMGIGPASYRPYGKVTSLQYLHVYYSAVNLSAHNNYVDLFAHGGIVGLGLFLWFMTELALLMARLRKRYTDGFAGGYVNSMLAAWVATMVIMALADWFLPFVYNIGFDGFQASALVWMFFGGVVALEQMAKNPAPAQEQDGSLDSHRQLEHA